MVSRSLFHSIGSFLTPLVGNVPAAARSAGAVNSSAVTRRGTTGAGPDLSTVAVIVMTGAVTGSPTAQSASAQLQHSTDGGSTWANIGSAVAVTAADGIAISDGINVQGAGASLRVVLTTAFTGGTTPTLLSTTAIVGLDEKALP